MSKFLLFFLLLGTSSFGYAEDDQISVKNFRQAMASYSSITGVNARDAEIQTIFRRVKSRLPVNGKLGEFASPSLLAYLELGGAFCKKLIEKDSVLPAAQRRMHKVINFDADVSQFDRVMTNKLVETYALYYWQRSPTEKESDLLWNAVQELKEEGTVNSILITVCGTFSSSVDFIAY
jgi:hypothetical protein